MTERDSTALAEYLRVLERRPRANPDEELFDQGLAFDLETLGPAQDARVGGRGRHRDGNYSLYGVTDQNYLPGVQEADADGIVTFPSIYPACYAGRWPHIHFEVYPSLGAATDAAKRIATSQLALRKITCTAVYATVGYEQSAANLGQVSLASDNVFGDDGGAQELGRVTGSIDAGLTVELTVPVAVT
jgi:hypothetical protein